MKKPSILAVIGVLTAIGAGALQMAVVMATITAPGIQIALALAIVCAVVMDSMVIHQMGTEPVNRPQLGVGLVIIGVLLVGLALDVVLLLTHESFGNETFGAARALVGVNIAVSLVLAAAFFALSETNTHERKLKALEQNSEMQQARAWMNTQEAARLYNAKAVTQFIARAADGLGIPVSELEKLWRAQGGRAPTLPPEQVATLGAALHRVGDTPANGGGVKQADAPHVDFP